MNVFPYDGRSLRFITISQLQNLKSLETMTYPNVNESQWFFSETLPTLPCFSPSFAPSSKRVLTCKRVTVKSPLFLSPCFSPLRHVFVHFDKDLLSLVDTNQRLGKFEVFKWGSTRDFRSEGSEFKKKKKRKKHLICYRDKFLTSDHLCRVFWTSTVPRMGCLRLLTSHLLNLCTPMLQNSHIRPQFILFHERVSFRYLVKRRKPDHWLGPRQSRCRRGLKRRWLT